MALLSITAPTEASVTREIELALVLTVTGNTGSPSTWHHVNGEGEQVSGTCSGSVAVTVSAG